ncbi:MAG: hypothetical protein IRY87_11570 [Acetobacteraceae bacterium]|mgnify:CR=1 FL=1|nr:hypothetical protein [Acetobacteraceae bacterium]
MRDRKNGWRRPALLTAPALALMLMAPGGITLAQQAGEAGQPPPRIGPEWDWRNHQPTEAEVEARERAAGRQPSANAEDVREVDQLYRELTGQNPTEMPRTPPRASDRR